MGASAHLLAVSLLTACFPGMLHRLRLSSLLPTAALRQLEDVHSMSAIQASKAKSRTTNAAVYCDRYHTCMTPWQAISRSPSLAFSHGSTARIHTMCTLVMSGAALLQGSCHTVHEATMSQAMKWIRIQLQSSTQYLAIPRCHQALTQVLVLLTVLLVFCAFPCPWILFFWQHVIS